MNYNTRQVKLSLAILAAILAVILLIAPARKKNLKSAKPSQSNIADIENIILNAKKSLDSEQLNQLMNWEVGLKTSIIPDKIAFYDSLGISWEIFKNPFIGAYYLKEKSLLDNDIKSISKSARMYMSAYSTSKDSLIKMKSLENAVDLFEKAILIEPNNNELKLELALSYIEQPKNPMKGIMMLREMAEQNPENENVLFNLGILSMRSGQFEKAINRFDQILMFKPERSELFLYIADCYVQLDEKNKAIDYFSRFKSTANNQGLVDEIDRYIEQLKEE